MCGMGRPCALALLLAIFLTTPAQGQYMFLDANGDGVNDDSDRIDQSGATTLDLWVDTAKNRDGSAVTCDTDPNSGVTVFSWEIVLRAVGGTLEWGPLDNILAISPLRACFATDSDTTDPVWYHNGWGGYYVSDPGRYHLARFSVRVLTGNPSIIFVPLNPSQPNDLTSLGTLCLAREQDNTYKLGLDWHDADGVGPRIMAADAGGPYRGIVSIPVRFDASASVNTAGGELMYQWDFGDGASGTGVAPTHAYAELGQYTASLTVTNGAMSHSTWTTVTIIDQTPPVARVGGPYEGYLNIPVLLDGRRSTDANGDPLSYSWSFGDATGASGAYVWHTYYAPGAYTVTLTVSDGHFTSTEATTVTIFSEPELPPIANAGGPYTGYAGAALRLDGTGSYDPDGDPLTYWWIFGDGEVGTGPTPLHAYAATGEYEVILEVWDGTLRTSGATTAIIVEPVGSPPAVNAGGPYRADVGETVELQGQATDPDGDSLTLQWDLGDGSVVSGLAATHAYAEPRVYTVLLTATDGVHFTQGRTTVTVSSPSATIVSRGPIVKPNPFNPQATVSFAISRPGRVRAEIFDVNGRLVRTLLRDVPMEAGGHDLAIDSRRDSGGALSSGVYFLRISGPDGRVTTRITIAK